jgi:hypothetical protein
MASLERTQAANVFVIRIGVPEHTACAYGALCDEEIGQTHVEALFSKIESKTTGARPDLVGDRDFWNCSQEVQQNLESRAIATANEQLGLDDPTGDGASFVELLSHCHFELG